MDLESSQVSKRPSFFETRLDIAYSYIGLFSYISQFITISWGKTDNHFLFLFL